MTTVTTTATVQTLTAQVRVLMVGSRQVTLSVFRQLDFAAIDDINIFGRVRDPSDYSVNGIHVIGDSKNTGALCRGVFYLRTDREMTKYWDGSKWIEGDEAKPLLDLWSSLEKQPLIVLAGLK